MDGRKLPQLTGPRDVRDVPRALEVDMRAEHPVTTLQRGAATSGWETKLAGAERVHGAAVAMGMRLDRAILGQFQRAPGLHSSFSGLDTLLGRDDELSFADFLGDPELRPELPRYNVHELLEMKTKMHIP